MLGIDLKIMEWSLSIEFTFSSALYKILDPFRVLVSVNKVSPFTIDGWPYTNETSTSAHCQSYSGLSLIGIGNLLRKSDTVLEE